MNTRFKNIKPGVILFSQILKIVSQHGHNPTIETGKKILSGKTPYPLK